jgi:parallel beta-helix repeat protein
MKYYVAALALLAFAGCTTAPGGKGDYTTVLSFGPGDEAKIAEAFLSLKDSSSIALKEGRYQFDNLSLVQLKHIQVKGAGADKTILDFSAQSQGGEGIRVAEVKGFTISGLTLRDSKGDLLKINKSENVTITGVHTIWSKADSSSGGYGIYPVLCNNVLIEDCYAEGASDAGIYVGQSNNAVVRKSKAYKNVAGCEIENTTNAEVYDNEFWGNTAGFLVFDLPDLSQRGGNVKAYNNHIHDNNERNFAKAGSFGTTWGVGNAAPGSGVIIQATSHVELYNNRIVNNNSGAIILVSGFFVDAKAGEKIKDSYFPISQHILIHSNTLEMGAAFPQPVYEHHTGKILVAIEQKLGARIPMIVYDGISSNILNNGSLQNPDSICIRQAGNNLFVNVNALQMESKDWRPSTDMTAFNCQK